MGGIIVLSIVYWLTAIVLFLIGLVKVIVSSSASKPTKPGLKLLIISAIMALIGFGACALIIGGIGAMH